MATRTKRADITRDIENGLAKYKFPDGREVVIDVKKIEPRYMDLTPLGKRGLLHGLVQHHSDSYADPTSDAYHEVRTRYHQLTVDHVWSERGEAAGPRVTLLAIALANLTARKAANEPNNIKIVATDDEISAMVTRLDAEAEKEAVEVTLEGGEKKTVTGEEKLRMTKKQPVVDAEIKRIMAERASAKAKEARQAASGATIDLNFLSP